jgi:hypothetical protein
MNPFEAFLGRMDSYEEFIASNPRASVGENRTEAMLAGAVADKAERDAAAKTAKDIWLETEVSRDRWL